MAHTLIRLRAGEEDTFLRYPAWALAAPPREQHVQRLTRTPVSGGAYVRPLGSDPVTLDLRLVYRPQSGGSAHWQAPLQELRALSGKALELFWGEIEWRSDSGWYIRNLSIQYGPEVQYPEDTAGGSPTEGGIQFPRVDVSLTLTTDDLSVYLPDVGG